MKKVNDLNDFYLFSTLVEASLSPNGQEKIVRELLTTLGTRAMPNES